MTHNCSRKLRKHRSSASWVWFKLRPDIRRRQDGKAAASIGLSAVSWNGWARTTSNETRSNSWLWVHYCRTLLIADVVFHALSILWVVVDRGAAAGPHRVNAQCGCRHYSPKSKRCVAGARSNHSSWLQTTTTTTDRRRVDRAQAATRHRRNGYENTERRPSKKPDRRTVILEVHGERASSEVIYSWSLQFLTYDYCISLAR